MAKREKYLEHLTKVPEIDDRQSRTVRGQASWGGEGVNADKVCGQCALWAWNNPAKRNELEMGGCKKWHELMGGIKLRVGKKGKMLPMVRKRIPKTALACRYFEAAPETSADITAQKRDGKGDAAKMCVECEKHPTDGQSGLCPGCEAYREHTAV